MSDPLTYPKLRSPLEVRMERVQNQDVILMRCPLGVTLQPLLLLPAAGPVISCFDGNSSRDEILQHFTPYGLTAEVLDRLIAAIDEHLFLDSPRFEAAYAKFKDDFAREAVRPPALAGGGYPAERSELTRLVDGYLARDGAAALPRRPLAALLSPHIDYRRGGPAYGAAYTALKDQHHDLYVLIGTAHQYSPHMFHLTRKDFGSPFGTLPCDKALVDGIAARYGRERSFADELLHRSEHSLELQIPFLGRLKKAPTIVPILVGSFHHMLTSGKSPEAFEEYESFAAALSGALAARASAGKRVCIVAGVDLAHVGRSFGDSGSLTPERMQRVGEQDKEFLTAVAAQDKKAVYAHVAADRDARHICGFPAIYTVMDMLDRLGVKYRAELLDYRQAVDYQTDCAVTFAGMGLYA